MHYDQLNALLAEYVWVAAAADNAL